MFEARIKF